MTESSDRYHGIFAKLAALNIYEGGTEELYGSELAEFYNRFLGEFSGDIPIFERFLDAGSSKVLDLACGSGRIGISLARKGHCVDGLEISREMLVLVDSNLKGESEEVKARLRFIEGDMTGFALPDRYDLITVGVTSISLLLGAEQRDQLFNRVRAHLKPTGKFIFDFLNLGSDSWKRHDHFLDVWSEEGADGVDFGIVGQRFFPEKKIFIFNVYRELVGWDGTTRRAIGTSTKAWLEEDELIEAMNRAGLRVAERIEADHLTYLVSEMEW